MPLALLELVLLERLAESQRQYCSIPDRTELQEAKKHPLGLLLADLLLLGSSHP